MGDTVCHPEERRSFRTVGRGNIDPSADVEMGTSSDNGCCRSHERRRARDDANRCSGGLGRANPCLLRHKYRNPEEREMKRIKRLALGLGVAALMVVAVGCGSGESSTARDTSSSAISVENASGNTVAPQAHNGPDTEPDVVRQDESVALATDMALTANQTGLPVESVERAIAFQQAFGKYVDELIDRFPDQISAVRTERRGRPVHPPEVTPRFERPPRMKMESRWIPVNLEAA